jgi:hypothetical protein
MSESAPATAIPSPIIMRIVSDHACAIEALAAASADSLDHATLRSSYENTINLTCTLYSSENLTNRFAMLVTKNEDLVLEHDATITNCNVLTTRVMQLKAQLTQTLAPVTTAINSLPAGRKGQTDPEKFTGEDRSKLRSFVALLRLRLIDHPREFLSEQVKLRYAFSTLEGAALEQMIHLIQNDHMNLKNFEAFVTSLDEAYGDPNHVNTAKRMLAKLRQGNWDFIMYYVKFQCLIADLDWNDAAKQAALHRGLSEELKDILSTQDLPEDWANYVVLVKKRDMQYHA